MQYHKKHPFLIPILILEFFLISIATLSLQFSSFILYIAAGIYCSQQGLGFSFFACPYIYYTALLYIIPPLFGIWLIYKITKNFYALMIFISIVIVVEQLLLLRSLNDLGYWNRVIQYGGMVADSVFNAH